MARLSNLLNLREAETTLTTRRQYTATTPAAPAVELGAAWRDVAEYASPIERALLAKL